MELSHRHLRSAFHAKFSRTLSRIQISGFATKPNLAKLKLDAEKSKLLRGVAFLFLAIIFAWVSLVASEEKGRLLFARTHWPQPQAWNETLASFQLKHQEQLGNWTALFKTLPNAFSDSSEIWANENGCYVYLSKSPFGHNVSAEFWTCAQPLAPTKWVNLGSGIEGFDRLIDFLNKNRPKLVQISTKKTPLHRNVIDPKEIRY
jgi:hypothetical protein